MPFISAIFSGIARALVGKGVVSRGIIYPVTAFLLVMILKPDYGYWAAALVAVPVFTMWFGRTDWSDSLFMAARYGVPVGAAGFLAGYLGADPLVVVPWFFASTAVGFFYQDMKQWVQDKGWSDQIPEFVAGAVIMGGAAFL